MLRGRSLSIIFSDGFKFLDDRVDLTIDADGKSWLADSSFYEAEVQGTNYHHVLVYLLQVFLP